MFGFIRNFHVYCFFLTSLFPKSLKPILIRESCRFPFLQKLHTDGQAFIYTYINQVGWMAFRSKPDLFQRTYKTFQFEAKQRGNGFRVQKKRVSFCKSKSDLEKQKKTKKTGPVVRGLINQVQTYT